MKKIHSIALTLVFALPLIVNAAEQTSVKPGTIPHQGMTPETMDMGKSSMPGAANMPEMASTSMSNGIIRKVNKSSKKITIKHGPLNNLGMGAMTMVFKVKDPAMLEQVKSGNKVNFVAESINGDLTVTKIEEAK
ncbi:copper-binding protein [Sulfurirhabdus autotrophica]|uniref:Copper binding protein CusF n=1 Tax=Sulfurirhabdus autotrophica TaxID=1706046 RepID=A0A4R3YE27_9PROT|nr:copper-binding protein [Sulfurirhabdus autotrophica]TCV90300.1 copper binding protein CusF [Sulfurirhabdus autotrophica]